MKCKAVLGVLALIGTLVLSATAAQAGDGGRPSALTSFFACYSINGRDTGQVVDLEVPDQSPIASADRSNVRIGGGALACAIVKLFVRQPVAGRVLAEPDPQQVGGFDAIKCYSVTGPGGTSLPGPSGPPYNAEDAFFGDLGTTDPPPDPPTPNAPLGATAGTLGTELGIQVSQLKYICGPATFGR